MQVDEIKKHRSICLMGLGSVFIYHHAELSEEFPVSYITDNDPAAAVKYPRYNYLSPDRLQDLDDPFVIVTTSIENYGVINCQLTAYGVPHCHFSEIEGIDENYPVVHLASLEGQYTDHLGNTIQWEGGIAPNTYVHFGQPRNGGILPIKARNNRLVIGKGVMFEGPCHIRFTGSGSSVEIGNNNWVGREMELAISANSLVKIGDNCTFESIYAVAQEGNITIGDDCMFSVRINLWQTDGHPIFDAGSGRRVNCGKNLSIGNHVWVGLEAFLLGGCTIGADCIVGARSVTSGTFPDGVILAGSPARVVRTGITWRKDALPSSPPIAYLSDCKN